MGAITDAQPQDHTFLALAGRDGLYYPDGARAGPYTDCYGHTGATLNDPGFFGGHFVRRRGW